MYLVKILKKNIRDRLESSPLAHIPIKIMLWTAAISLFILFFTDVYLNTITERQTQNKLENLSLTLRLFLPPLIESQHEDIIHRDEIFRLFSNIVDTSDVLDISLLNEECITIFSYNKDEIGKKTNKALSIPKSVNETNFVRSKKNMSTYEMITLIPLKDASQYILLVDYDMSYELDYIKKVELYSLTTIYFFLGTLLIITLSIIKKEIIAPLKLIKGGMFNVLNGNYNYKINSNKNDEINDLITIFNSMAHKIKVNSELMRLNEEKSKKLAKSKTMFFSNMTHELRTPLNSIIGYSEILLEEEESESKKKKMKSIVDAGNHLLLIINGILDFSKLEANKLKLANKPFNLISLLKSIDELFKPKIDKRMIEFKITYADTIPEYFLGDESKVRQILINLINNAIKFTREGSIYINVRYSDNLQRLYIDVEDTGSGIPKNLQKKIFESFEQADVTHSGTGLGLPITKKLCQLMEGEISVRSAPNDGSTFSLRLQLKKTNKPVEIKFDMMDELDEVMNESHKTFEETKLDILVAEDIPENQVLLSLMLKKQNVNLEFANNGQDALNLFRSKKYDLFFLDIQMPIMDGMEVLKELRSTGEIEDIYIIALTAYAMKSETKKILEAGADSILTKPIIKESLRALVSERKRKKEIEKTKINLI